MRSLFTLMALITFAFAGTYVLAQDEEGESKKLRRIDPAASKKTEATPEDDGEASRQDELDEQITALRNELRAIDEKRRGVARRLLRLESERRRLRRDQFRAPGRRRDGLSIDLDDALGRLGVFGGGNGVSIQSGPDGVRVEIRERDEDGELQTETYEAESLEAFRKEHPDIAEKYGIGGGTGMSFEIDPDTFGFAFPEAGDMDDFRLRMDELRERLEGLRGNAGQGFVFPPSSPLAPRVPGVPPAPRERLGVMVAPLDADQAEELSLEAGEGLVIQEVQPNTLAARLGLRAGDTLLSVNGQTVVGAGSIASALGELSATDTVKVEVDRPGRGRQTLEAKKVAPKIRGKRI